MVSDARTFAFDPDNERGFRAGARLWHYVYRMSGNPTDRANAYFCAQLAVVARMLRDG